MRQIKHQVCFFPNLVQQTGEAPFAWRSRGSDSYLWIVSARQLGDSKTAITALAPRNITAMLLT